MGESLQDNKTHWDDTDLCGHVISANKQGSVISNSSHSIAELIGKHIKYGSMKYEVTGRERHLFVCRDCISEGGGRLPIDHSKGVQFIKNVVPLFW